MIVYFFKTLMAFVPAFMMAAHAFMPAFMMAAHAFEAGLDACVSVSSMATIVPKLLQGAVALFCSMDAAGTWSVAFLMSELLKTLYSVEGTFPA